MLPKPSEGLKVSVIKAPLENLLVISRRLGLPFVDLLQPGLSYKEITQKIQSLGIIAPLQLVEFYEFCNGVQSDGHWTSEVELYQGYWILPLQEAIQQYDLLQRTNDNGYVQKSWFPLLKCDRDSFVVDCTKALIGEACIINYMPELGPIVTYFDIKSMINTFADCYHEGAFVVSGRKVIGVDFKRVVKISIRHNPNVEFWLKCLDDPRYIDLTSE